MTKHTPGSWRAGLDLPWVANNDPDPRIIWSDSLQVADTRSMWISQEVAEANARLIAEAPAMLGEIKAYLDYRAGENMCVDDIAANMRAIISRIELTPHPAAG